MKGLTKDELEEAQRIHSAWRDAEAYAVPVTEAGMEKADERRLAFQQGWRYAMFYAKHGTVYKRKFEEEQEYQDYDN